MHRVPFVATACDPFITAVRFDLKMKHPHLFAAHEDGPESRPHLPGFRSWGGVYVVVMVCFVAYVVMLTVFTRVFS